MIGDIHALVVTYNRRELVMRSLDALLRQTHALTSIIVVDNGGSDGTGEAILALRPSNGTTIDYLRVENNLGAAGGFNHGMDYAFGSRKLDWVWIMDDDVVPSETALAVLVEAYEHNFHHPEEVGFLVSQLVDGEGRANNVPTVDTRPRQVGECARWGLYLDQGIVAVRSAALTALLMPRTTYESFGNLNPDFVVWGEDTELTFRITEQRPGYIVGRSKVVHLRGQPGDISIFLEDEPTRVPNFYYLYRNMVYVRRRYVGVHAYVNGIVRGVLEASQLAVSGKWWKAQIALRGTMAGVVFNPKVPLPPR